MMQQQVNSFTWINPALEISKSEIRGEGYFASSDIEKDELLVVQGGQCLHVSEIDNTDLDQYSYHGFQVEKEIYIFPIYIDGKPVVEGIFKINHSCDPNAGFRGQISLVSMRDIQEGEEICIDYAMTDIEFNGEKLWVPETCNCKTPVCRKTITGADWNSEALQKRYNGYFSTHVANAIAAFTDTR